MGVRDTCNDDNTSVSTCQPFAKLFQYRSLPNIAFGEYDLKMSPKIRETETTFYYRASSEPNNNYISNPCIVMEQTKNDEGATSAAAGEQPGEEEEHAISGRLEIRVLSKDKLAKEPSPNPEESIYFDAVVTNGPQTASSNNVNNGDESKPKSADKENVQYEEEFIWINKKEPQEKKYDIKVYEDSLKIQKYKIITVDKSEDGLDDEEGGVEEEKDDDEKEKEIVRDGGVAAAMQERDESTTDNRIEIERLRDCSSSSNSKIPVFNPTGSARMLSQRSSWAGMEDGPDISDLTPGKRRF